MQIYFPTREQARKASFGVMKDNGQQAFQGKRFARNVSATTNGKDTTFNVCPITGTSVAVTRKNRNFNLIHM